MSRTVNLKLPLDEAAVSELQVGDMVNLSGDLVLVGGLPTHERICEYLAQGRELPIELRGATILHFGGYNYESDGQFKLRYLNPTTSTRFNPYMPTLIRGLGLRAVGGKGGLDAASAAAMREVGCVYLSFPGGACTLFTNAIREVKAVEWNDFIIHYRLVQLQVEDLGPGTVAIDAQGRSLYDELSAGAASAMPAILHELDRSRAETPH
ncbi:MAG: fumarate hydratase C-terminal domain-containing protein [Burkholderiales bacterium]|nr:fumarate hydratase C-terminal domain-containing protein [Burkholderiales bacterium]